MPLNKTGKPHVLFRYKQSEDDAKCLPEPPAAVNEVPYIFFIFGSFTFGCVLTCLLLRVANMFGKLNSKEDKEDPEAGSLVNDNQEVGPPTQNCVEHIHQATDTNIEDPPFNQGGYKDSHVAGSIPSVSDAEIFTEDPFSQVWGNLQDEQYERYEEISVEKEETSFKHKTPSTKKYCNSKITQIIPSRNSPLEL